MMRIRLSAVVLAATVGLTLAACGGDDEAAEPTPAQAGTTTALTAEGVKVTYVSYYRAPYAQNIADGAELAATEASADFSWVGPAGIDPPAQIKAFQDTVQAGTKGALVGAFPSDLWRRPIDTAVDDGVTVISSDVASPGSRATSHFGPNKRNLGKALAEEFAKVLDADAKGTIVGGECVPGLPALRQPFEGFKERLKELVPGVEVKGPLPTDVDPGKNFTVWQRIIDQNPDAVGFIGQCDQDIPNLIKLKRSSGDDYLVGNTSGDGPENLAAVQDGTVVAIIGLNGFVEGYTAMYFLLDQLANGTEPPQGFVDTGLEVINKDAAAAAIDVRKSSDPKEQFEFYRSQIEGILANPNPVSIDQCGGCA